MFRFLIKFLAVFFIVVSLFVCFNSQRTFEAKFKHIDGLPKGAPVTVLGVKIGEVIRTTPTKDGILVKVRLTNKSASTPQAGSQLTITSFRPNQGRALEIIPPNIELQENTAWVIQEPITTESWMYASLELLEGLKNFSKALIKHVTPENFKEARLVCTETSKSLNSILKSLQNYEDTLSSAKEKFSAKTREVNQLLFRIKAPIDSLNEIISDKNITTGFKNDLLEFSDNITLISQNIINPEFIQNIFDKRNEILSYLNQINASLIANDEKITNSQLKQKIKQFNMHILNLNEFYENVQEEDIKKMKESISKARKIITDLEHKTAKFQMTIQPIQN